jgi:hypothetical protein
MTSAPQSLRFAAAPPLRIRERITHAARANCDDTGTAVGGALYVTTERIVFCPNTIERWLGRHAWEVPLERTGVATGENDAPELAGGRRMRVYIRSSDGEEHQVRVGDPIELENLLLRAGLFSL